MSDDAVLVATAAVADCPHCTQKLFKTTLPQHHFSTATADPPHMLQNLSPIIILYVLHYDIITS